MRERLDDVDPRSLRRCFSKIYAALRRGRALEKWTALDARHLIAVDGTEHHSPRRSNAKTAA